MRLTFGQRTLTALGACMSAVALITPPGVARAEMDAFQRSQTVQAALKWLDFPYVIPWSDCTFYVSSALWDGGMASTPDWTPRTSDPSKLASTKIINPGPSKIAANADMFKKNMVNTGRATIREVKWSDITAGGAALADIIAYDWDSGADGVVDHLAMVTSITADGYPQVSQHSPTRKDRGWSWDPDANKWIQASHPGARVYLIHFV